MYKGKLIVFSEIQKKKNTQRKASAMQNFWKLNVVVGKETARL